MKSTIFLVLKLVSGEELVCTYLNITEDVNSYVLRIKNPFCVTSPLAHRKSPKKFRLFPWVQVSSNLDYNIDSWHIMHINQIEPESEIGRQFMEAIHERSEWCDSSSIESNSFTSSRELLEKIYKST